MRTWISKLTSSIENLEDCSIMACSLAILSELIIEGGYLDGDLPQSRINERNITSEMRESFLDYAMSVIVSRALPDVRDGLKPVHRRILYGLNEQGMTPDKPYKNQHVSLGM